MSMGLVRAVERLAEAEVAVMEFLGWSYFAMAVLMAFSPVILLFAFAAGEVYDPGVRK